MEKIKKSCESNFFQGIPGHTLNTNVPIRGRQNYGNGNGNGRVALLNDRNDLELSVPRNRNNREMIKIEVHKPENKMVSKHY